MSRNPPRFRLGTPDRLLLAAVVAFACLLRLWDLPLVSITADEGIHGLFARNVSLLDVEKFPAVGLPSVGVRNSALFVYLLAIPNFVVRHPLSGAAFIALLQVWAIVMTYRYALRWSGRTAAVTASFLWTFAPWAVLYARNMWPPSALAPFVLLLLGAGTRWFVEGDRRALTWVVFLSFILPQVHFSGFCAPIWVGLLLLARLRRMTSADWRRIGLATVLGLLTWAPWIHWQHFANHWQDLSSIRAVTVGDAAAEGAGRMEKSLQGVRDYLPRLVEYFRDLLHTGGLGYWFRTPEAELPEYFPRWRAPLRFAVDRGMEIAFVAGSILAFRSTVGRLLLLWTFLPVVLLALIRPSLHPHYEFIAYPAPYLIIGIGAQALLTNAARRAAGAVLLLGAIAAFGLTLDGWRRYVADGRPDGGDRYQLSYRQRLAAVHAVLDDAAGVHVEIVGPFSGQQPAYSLLFVHEVGRRSHGRWPRDPAHVYWMDELTGEGLSQEALRALAGVWPYLRDVRVEKSWRVGPTRIFRLAGTPGRPPER